MIENNVLHKKKSISYWSTLVSYVLLLVLISLSHWWVYPPEVDSLTLVWFLRIAPLCLFIPAFILDNSRWYIWMCFVLLFYFITAAADAWLRQGLFSWLHAGVVMFLFCSSLYHFKKSS